MSWPLAVLAEVAERGVVQRDARPGGQVEGPQADPGVLLLCLVDRPELADRAASRVDLVLRLRIPGAVAWQVDEDVRPSRD